jgi:hypothetical protein
MPAVAIESIHQGDLTERLHIVTRSSYWLRRMVVVSAFLLVGATHSIAVENDPAALERAIEFRDAAIRRIHFEGIVTDFDLSGVRLAGESDDAYVNRVLAMNLEEGKGRPFSVSADFDNSAVYFETQPPAPGKSDSMFHKYLKNGEASDVAFSHPNGNSYARISCPANDEFTYRQLVERMDLRIFRPIDDAELHSVIHSAIHSTLTGPPRVGGHSRPFHMTMEGNHADIHLRQIKQVGIGTYSDTFYRLDFTVAGDEYLLTRLDLLSGNVTSKVPTITSAYEDYQTVDGVQIPHCVKRICFSGNRIFGSVARATRCAVNTGVTLPEKLELQPGTYVQDFKGNTKFRVPISGEAQDEKIATDVNALRRDARFHRWGVTRVTIVLVNAFLLGVLGLLWYRKSRHSNAIHQPVSTGGEPQ